MPLHTVYSSQQQVMISKACSAPIQCIEAAGYRQMATTSPAGPGNSLPRRSSAPPLMRSCDSDASMPPADGVAQGASPGGPSNSGAPAACGDSMHAQQPTEHVHSAPGQSPAAAHGGMEAAAAQHPVAPPDARPAAVLAGGGGAAAIGSPADAGVMLDDVDVAEQRRILQDIAVRQQDSVRDCLLPPAAWGLQVWACSIISCSASHVSDDTTENVRSQMGQTCCDGHAGSAAAGGWKVAAGAEAWRGGRHGRHKAWQGSAVWPGIIVGLPHKAVTVE